MADTMNTYWYAFVTAAPNPEIAEAVNVGFVLGNGKAFRLEYERDLPRLSGLVAGDEIGVYEAILSRVAEKVSRGVDLQFLEAVLGPQLRLTRPRALVLEPSEALIGALRTTYLSTPRIPYPDPARLLQQRAAKQLDRLISLTKPPALSLVKKATPRRLYEARLDRYVHYRIPSVARAVRGEERDLLLDSVLIDAQNMRNALRTSALRISRAFYSFGKLRPVILTQAGREIRRVGIIYPGQPGESEDVLEARDWVRHTLERDADRLIDGSSAELMGQLKEEMDWATHAA